MKDIPSRQLICALMLMLLSSLLSTAQSNQITVRVLDKDSKSPVKGALVLKGDSLYTKTNYLGYFQLQAAPNDTIIVRHEQYGENIINVPAQLNFAITLKAIETNVDNSRSPEFILLDHEKYDTPPSYAHGGTDSLNEFFYYNYEDPMGRIEGTIFIKFRVLENRQLDSIKIIRGLKPWLDKEAIRVLTLTSGDWNPAKINGINVKTAVVYKFFLQYGKYQFFKNLYETSVLEIKSEIKSGDFDLAVKNLTRLATVKSDNKLCQLRNELPKVHQEKVQIKTCK